MSEKQAQASEQGNELRQIKDKWLAIKKSKLVAEADRKRLEKQLAEERSRMREQINALEAQIQSLQESQQQLHAQNRSESEGLRSRHEEQVQDLRRQLQRRISN